MKEAISNDLKLAKMKNDTKNGIVAIDTFFKTLFKIKKEDERTPSEVEISEKEDESKV